MSIPIICSCGELIGEEEGMGSGWDDGPRKCNGAHPSPRYSEKTHMFGLLKRIHIRYPLTNTDSAWDAYIGPANVLLLWLAVMASRPITVCGGLIWWSWKFGKGFGFFSTGWENFKKSSRKTGR